MSEPRNASTPIVGQPETGKHDNRGDDPVWMCRDCGKEFLDPLHDCPDCGGLVRRLH